MAVLTQNNVEVIVMAAVMEIAIKIESNKRNVYLKGGYKIWNGFNVLFVKIKQFVPMGGH